MRAEPRLLLGRLRVTALLPSNEDVVRDLLGRLQPIDRDIILDKVHRNRLDRTAIPRIEWDTRQVGCPNLGVHMIL